jgi:uncharacterized protein with PQ loop repeat
VSLHEVGVLSGYLGATLGAAMVVPQIIRVVGNRSLPGVSALAWSLTVLTCFTWLLYGVRTHELPQIAGNVVIVSGAASIVLLVPNKTPAGARAIRLAVAMLAVSLVAVVASPTVVGLVAFSIGGCSSWPQVVASFTRDAGLPSAVSIGAWLLRCASQVAWLFYAVVIHDLPVTISACTLLASAILVLALERRRSHADVTETALAIVPAPAAVS